MLTITPRKELIIVLLLIIVAFCLRVYHIGNYGIFSDEKQGILIAISSTNINGDHDIMAIDKVFTPQQFWVNKGYEKWADAYARGDTSGNSLFYNLFLKLFSILFGPYDASLRMVSVFFNILTLWVIYKGLKGIFPKSNIALIALFLATIEPFFIVFSQQARSYSMSIFATTLASFLYWKIVNTPTEKLNRKYYLYYGILVITSFFSHYLVFIIFVAHAIYSLLYVRDFGVIKKMILTVSFSIIPFLAWIIYGPGKYASQYKADSLAYYLWHLKTKGEVPGWIEYANFGNLSKRIIEVFSDLFFFTNDFYDKFGFKIGGIVVFIWLLILLFLFFTTKSTERRFFVFSLLLVFLPSIFLIYTALDTNVTTGFFLRYASFGISFSIFLTAYFIDYIIKSKFVLKYVLLIFVIIQCGLLFKHILALYADKLQKYSYSSGRVKNPYPMIATKIDQLYALNDTVVYPSFTNKSFDDRVTGYETKDAQLVNLYLPHNATYLQKINPFEPNKVILKKSSGEIIELFNFEGTKYRY